MKTILLAAFAACGLTAGTIDGVTYTLQYSDAGSGYADYVWYFSEPVSAYSMNVVWYGYPADFQIITTYGAITQQSTQYGIMFLTLSGVLDGSPASIQYDTSAFNFLTVQFQSPSRAPFSYPSMTFTSLTDPPLHAFDDPPASAPEPGTIVITALGLFALALARRWSIQRNTPALCALRAPRAAGPQPCK